MRQRVDPYTGPASDSQIGLEGDDAGPEVTSFSTLPPGRRLAAVILERTYPMAADTGGHLTRHQPPHSPVSWTRLTLRHVLKLNLSTLDISG